MGDPPEGPRPEGRYGAKPEIYGGFWGGGGNGEGVRDKGCLVGSDEEAGVG